MRIGPVLGVCLFFLALAPGALGQARHWRGGEGSGERDMGGSALDRQGWGSDQAGAQDWRFSAAQRSQSAWRRDPDLEGDRDHRHGFAYSLIVPAFFFFPDPWAWDGPDDWGGAWFGLAEPWGPFSAYGEDEPLPGSGPAGSCGAWMWSATLGAYQWVDCPAGSVNG
ncbi:MAG: hypothetical protein ACRED9_05245 [Caulobacteraceae bacterium]